MATDLSVSRRRMYLFGAVAILVVFGPAYWLAPGKYGAYAAGIQAAGVLLALIFAYVTLTAQNRATADSIRSQVELDRVGRTLGFHEALVSGEIQGARIRLIDHVRAPGVGGSPLRVSLETLRGSEYLPNAGLPPAGEGYLHTPFHDVNIVLRFFERAGPALELGLVDEALFHKMLGRHIIWWDEMLDRDGESVRYALSGLADWVWDYFQQNPAQNAHVANWIDILVRDFPNSRYAGLSFNP